MHYAPSSSWKLDLYAWCRCNRLMYPGRSIACAKGLCQHFLLVAIPLTMKPCMVMQSWGRQNLFYFRPVCTSGLIRSWSPSSSIAYSPSFHAVQLRACFLYATWLSLLRLLELAPHVNYVQGSLKFRSDRILVNPFNTLVLHEEWDLGYKTGLLKQLAR